MGWNEITVPIRDCFGSIARYLQTGVSGQDSRVAVRLPSRVIQAWQTDGMRWYIEIPDYEPVTELCFKPGECAEILIVASAFGRETIIQKHANQLETDGQYLVWKVPQEHQLSCYRIHLVGYEVAHEVTRYSLVGISAPAGLTGLKPAAFASSLAAGQVFLKKGYGIIHA